MLNLSVDSITQGGAGPVIHASEPGGAKIEAYLVKGYDTPEIGSKLVLVSADQMMQINADLQRLTDELAALKPDKGETK